MRTTIDMAGRLVIPAAIRRQAGLEPGMAVDVQWRGDRIEIEPASLPVQLVREGRLLVAVPQSATKPLRAETVEATRRAVERERVGGT